MSSASSRAPTLRTRFGLRSFLVSLLVLGSSVIGTGLLWRSQLLDDLTTALGEQIDLVESELETLRQIGRLPDGENPYVLPDPARGVQVVSETGIVVAASQDMGGRPPALTPESVSAPATTATTVIEEGTGRRTLVSGEAFTLESNTYVVEARIGLEVVDAASRLTFIAGPVIAVVVAAGIGLTVAASVGSALRPVRTLSRRAADIASSGRPDRLAVEADTAELGDLSTQLDRMLDRIRAAFDREQAFLDDASHELRTPIAIARTELELARREAPDPSTMAALDSAIEELDRVARTATQLLVLARARAAGDHGFEILDLGNLVRTTVGRLHRSSIDQGKLISISGSAEICGDQTAIERALVNLVENALRHAAETVWITVDDGDPVVLAVADDGPGFPDAIIAHIFDRFTRGLDRKARGTGLGTAIAAAIVDVHGGSIEASNRAEGGGVVTIRLPRPHPRPPG